MGSPYKNHVLRFRKDGTFRVVMMSDLQESTRYDPRSLRSVEALLDECQPDPVVCGGDTAAVLMNAAGASCSFITKTPLTL